jgi:hypothetical protein
MLSGYWTDGVGCSIETLAELMGDTPKIAFDHYGKEWVQHYQDPLWAAIGEMAKPETAERETLPTTRARETATLAARKRRTSGRKSKMETHAPRRPR